MTHIPVVTDFQPIDRKTQALLKALITEWSSLDKLARRLGVRAAVLTAGAAGARLTFRSRQLITAGLARYRNTGSGGGVRHLRVVPRGTAAPVHAAGCELEPAGNSARVNGEDKP